MRTKLFLYLSALTLIVCCGCAFNQTHEERGHIDYDQRDERDRVR